MRLLPIILVGLLGSAALADPPASVSPAVSKEPPVSSPLPVDPPSADDEEKESEETPEAKQVPTRINEFQGDNIGLVLRTLARQAGVNLVLSDQVESRSGTVTMRLENKTPLEAIEIIVHSKGLIMDQVNGVYFIKSAEELVREPTSRQLERLSKEITAPLAQLKGKYYTQLVEQGVPPATASEIVLREELSKGAFSHAGSEPGTMRPDWAAPSSKSGSFESMAPAEWLTFSAIAGATIAGIPAILLHLTLAFAVWFAANRVERGGELLTFFGPFLWAAATLAGGVLVAVLFWLIHFSTLRRTTGA